jgi:hypothetical protein
MRRTLASSACIAAAVAAFTTTAVMPAWPAMRWLRFCG